MRNLFDRLTGMRKVIVTILSMALATILLICNQITSSDWVEFNKWLLPAFMASNFLSKMTGKDGRLKEESN